MAAASALIFETSTPSASLALAGPDGTLHRRDFTSDRSHNAALFAPLAELLGDPVQEIRIVVIGSGPGSYSGTRVGIAAGQGVAIARGCPAVAVPSILGTPSAENGAACLAIGDARRGSYWVARIANSDLPADPELIDAAGLQEIVAHATATGTPVITFEEPAKFPLPPELIAAIRQEIPDAVRLWHAWTAAPAAARARWQSAPPQPIYLKPPHITPAKGSVGNAQ